MTTDATMKPSKAPAEPKIKVVQVNPETFDLICRALFNNSTELHAMARDISELRLAMSHLGTTLSAMTIDLHSIAETHLRPTNIETLSQRIASTGGNAGAGGDDMPLVLRNVQGAAR